MSKPVIVLWSDATFSPTSCPHGWHYKKKGSFTLKTRDLNRENICNWLRICADAARTGA